MNALRCTLVILLVASGCEPYPGTDPTGSSGSPGSSGASPSGAGRRPIDSQSLCKRLVDDCRQATTFDDCVRQFTAVLVSAACADALAGASCAELTSPRSPTLEACFPACSGTLATCNGDGSITICTASGTTNVLDCEAACRADGARAYSGECGLSHGVEVAPKPQCWCE